MVNPHAPDCLHCKLTMMLAAATEEPGADGIKIVANVTECLADLLASIEDPESRARGLAWVQHHLVVWMEQSLASINAGTATPASSVGRTLN